MRVVLTRRTERQLDKLHRYITGRSGEDRADAYIGRIVSFCQGLAVSRNGARGETIFSLGFVLSASSVARRSRLRWK